MNEIYGNIPHKVLKTKLDNEYWLLEAPMNPYVNTTLKFELDRILEELGEPIEYAEWNFIGPKLTYFTAYLESYIILLELDDFNGQYLRVVPTNPTM